MQDRVDGDPGLTVLLSVPDEIGGSRRSRALEQHLLVELGRGVQVHCDLLIGDARSVRLDSHRPEARTLWTDHLDGRVGDAPCQMTAARSVDDDSVPFRAPRTFVACAQFPM